MTFDAAGVGFLFDHSTRADRASSPPRALDAAQPYTTVRPLHAEDGHTRSTSYAQPADAAREFGLGDL